MTTVVQLSDLHLGRPDTDGRAARAVAGVRALDPAPDVVLVTGDLADDGAPEAYSSAARLLDGLGALHVPGNHDDRAAMADAVGPVGDRLHRTGGTTVALLDTLVPGAPHGALSDAAVALLAEAVRDPAPLLVALHHPPVAVGHPVLDGMRLLEAGVFEALLAARSDPTLVVCGHVHTPLATTFAGHPLVVAPSVAPALRWPDVPGTGGSDPVPAPGGVLHVLGDGPPRSRFLSWPV
ncbi:MULTISPECIES: metallophosphoesterase [Pseudonocardia]|uniref:3',5'-cyclic AMP phosphodiesterase CpdA n=1 Tax=Pseudonocardia alni TaxID=33907 RepID=A0A852VVG4_PSEA5|nr:MULTISPECIES: metallophosphoesterase [Pseudonocardia]MCO7194055.1 metallophosphoesterase [Pseudonocardia sp. McavD-2-B]NYG00417.1 3',5'-cyclic AMP phosphodiesterase CpdA [Pseudonocardia antarctica]